MAQGKLKRIAIENLIPGMILGTDVINTNGLILIPKDTVINEKHLFRLQLYQILSVVIFENIQEDIHDDVAIEEPTSLSENEVSIPIAHSFSEFRDNYFLQEEIVHSKLKTIGNGENVELNDLLNISMSLLSSLRTKSELFNYLYHLRAVDDYTYTHSINVSLLSNIFGHWLNFNQERIDTLTIAGLLHDIGKIKIDQRILNKPGKLTSNEFELVKKHAEIGYEIVKNMNFSDDIKYSILMHHEKTDGSGYPHHLSGDEINEFAKIISIVDIYDAMTSNRSYHLKFSPFKVIQIFEQESFGTLDIHYLFVFLENIAHNYLGKQVRLSTNEEAKIVFIHNSAPSRPIVQLGDSMLDLIEHPSIMIEEIL